MIAKSDLIILAVSTTALAAGIYRWQQNVQAPRIAAAPPPPVERVVEGDALASGAAGAGTAVVGRVSDETTGESDPDAVRVRRVNVAEPEPDTGEAAIATAPEVTTRTDPIAPEPDGGTTESLARADAADDAPLYGTYLVREGDYLGRIANQFGTSVATLQSINGIDGTTILVGDELLYPLPAN